MQVLYGMDYVAAAREAQHEHMRSALLAHVRLHPQSLLVVEEYDKLDCATRGLFRQVIENPASANISLERRAQPGACPCMRLFAPRVCGLCMQLTLPFNRSSKQGTAGCLYVSN